MFDYSGQCLQRGPKLFGGRRSSRAPITSSAIADAKASVTGQAFLPPTPGFSPGGGGLFIILPVIRTNRSRRSSSPRK